METRLADAADGLLSPALRPLPLGAVRPLGWLARQLRIQADGLSGHLDEFWPDVAHSGWIGGDAEGWERGPYWLDGVVPLAFLLDDAALQAKVRRWVEYIVAHQQADGWLGPVQSQTQFYQCAAYDPWPGFVALKALTQYYEATGEAAVLQAITRYLHKLAHLLPEQSLFDWGRMRWQDLVLTIHWLYERTGAEWLLDLAALAHEQGYDWRAHFDSFPWKGRVTAEEVGLLTHVVNSAQAIKASGVWYRQSRDEGDRQAVYDAIATLDRYHGQVTGVFSGDEHYAGRSPSQGTELCAVNEYLFSLEVLASILGDVALADRLERIVFNALPATFSPDMWAHQYDQQANQVICRVAEDRVYTTNGPDANIYGLEPHYGCCTANLSQGWPKFVAHLWMATPDGGLAAVAYAPCVVQAQAGGAPVRVTCETAYPFDEMVRIMVEPEQPAHFSLRLRIPGWAQGAQVGVTGAALQSVQAGGWHVVEREWSGRSEVILRLPMRFQVERRYNDAVAIHRGPLVYSLRIGEEWRQVGGELPHADWEVYPTTPWNYGLQLDVEQPERSLRLERRPLGDPVFSPEGAPLWVYAQGRRLPDWGLERNAAAPPPPSPMRSEEPLEEVVLIPYGCTNLRVSEFPVVG